jgi:hypothetical protein
VPRRFFPAERQGNQVGGFRNPQGVNSKFQTPISIKLQALNSKNQGG